MNKYAPLTAEEMAATPVPATPVEDDGELVSPVPDNAPPPPQSHFKFGDPTMCWEYRDANGATLLLISRFDKPDGEKEYLPLTLWRGPSCALKWRWKNLPAPRPLYSLDRLAARPKAPVVICEGEKAADAAARIFPKSVITTSPGGSQAARKADWSPLAGRRVLIWPDADEPGAKYAREVAENLSGAGCEVSIVDAMALASRSPAGGARTSEQGWDAADAVAEWQDYDALREAAHSLLSPYEPSSPQMNSGGGPNDPGLEQEIARLASLPSLAYDRERKAVAEKLGCRISTLDKLVTEKRQEKAAQQAIDLCADTEPCAEPINLAELLDEVRATILRFITCESATATAATLWIAFTWIIDHVHVAPLAIITAPEKRCGKTQLLDVIGRLSRRALLASNISPAATFRVIEAKSPTLLIDEADAFFRENEELRGIINSGHTRTTAFVIRTVGDDHEPKRFSTWGAKAIAGIGRLPETVMDRAIVLPLRRKLPHEKVERLRHAEPHLLEALARKLARFGLDHGAAIGRARPHLPDELNDRQQDNWEPLLAIAALAGGDWPDRARRTAMTISGAETSAKSVNEELLADIRDVFDRKCVTRISMSDLLEALCGDEEAPWATWNRGKPMNARQLSGRLKEFGIHAKSVYISAQDKPKGFKREQFEDAFKRYLDGEAHDDILSPDAPLPSVTQSPPYRNKGLDVDREVTEKNPPGHQSPEVTEHVSHLSASVTSRSTRNPIFSGQRDQVTDETPLVGKDTSPDWVEGDL